MTLTTDTGSDTAGKTQRYAVSYTISLEIASTVRAVNEADAKRIADEDTQRYLDHLICSQHVGLVGTVRAVQPTGVRALPY